MEGRVRLPRAAKLDVLHHCTPETVESGHEPRQLRAGHQSSRHPGRTSASRATGASPPSFPSSPDSPKGVGWPPPRRRPLTQTTTGGRQVGKVRFAATAPELPAYFCHSRIFHPAADPTTALEGTL